MESMSMDATTGLYVNRDGMPDPRMVLDNHERIPYHVATQEDMVELAEILHPSLPFSFIFSEYATYIWKHIAPCQGLWALEPMWMLVRAMWRLVRAMWAHVNPCEGLWGPYEPMWMLVRAMWAHVNPCEGLWGPCEQMW
jgi:hypothetical protein